jgi:DNA repair protein RecO
MKQIVSEAIVLRRINYGEADRIITFLTPEEGRVTVIAKGVRKANSKLAGSVELFGSSQITYLPGKGNMGTLISARLIKNFGNIVKDLQRTQLGYEVLKLINKSIEDEGEEAIYDLLASVLESLDDKSISQELVKFWFSLKFLELMGHSPNLTIENQNDSENFIFNADKMQFIGDNNGIYNKNHIKVFRLTMQNNPKKLSKITDIDKIMKKNLNITQTMLIDTGFNPI